MIAGVALFAIPSRDREVPLLSWDDSKKLPWGILLLFGGGWLWLRALRAAGWRSGLVAK